MLTKIIGIPANMKTNASTFQITTSSDLNTTYSNAIYANGGIALILPYVDNTEFLLPLLATCDGFLFPGGGDLDPIYYGEEPHQLLGSVNMLLDKFQTDILKYAIDNHKPILGICRGMQLLSVLEGGSLYQDLSQFDKEHLTHLQQPASYVATHHVEIKKDSLLYKIFNKDTIRINSFHHQSVKDIPHNYIASAYAKDGIIEAIEYTKDDFRLGLQWHPEAMVSHHPHMNQIFQAFLNACE